MNELYNNLLSYFHNIDPKQVIVFSSGLVMCVLGGMITSKLFRILESFFDKRNRVSYAGLISLIRLPLSLFVFLSGIILLDIIMGWSNLFPSIFQGLKLLFYLLFAWAFIRSMEYIFIERMLFEKHEVRMPKLLRDLTIWGIYVVIFLILMKTLFPKTDLTVFVTTSAVVSFILGFALQDTLSNLFAGLALHFEGSFALGQWISFEDWEGEVAGITWRSIKIRTFENDYVIIPNSTIAKSELTNYSQPTKLHIQKLPIGVHYDTPPGKLKKVCLEVLDKVDGILANPPRTIQLVKYNDFSIDYEIRFWIRDYARYKIIRDEVYSLLWYYFKRENIIIPFPIRTIHMPEKEDPEAIIERELDHLRKVDFINAFNDDEIRIILDSSQPMVFAEGEVIVEQKKSNDTFFIIKSGLVEVVAEDTRGYKKIVAKLSEGEYFGENSLFTGENANATVMAKEDTELATFSKKVFEEIIVSNPKVAEQISKIVSEREVTRMEILAKSDSTEESKISTTQEAQVQAYANRFLNKMKNLFKF